MFTGVAIWILTHGQRAKPTREVQMMPLKAMEAIRARCGVTDARPANEWLCAVLKALIEAKGKGVL